MRQDLEKSIKNKEPRVDKFHLLFNSQLKECLQQIF